MRKPLAIILAVSFFFLVSACGADTPASQPAASAPAPHGPPDPGELALAERLAQMAQTNLTLRPISDITMKESAALLEAATKLNPYERRYYQLRAEACLSLRDVDGAIESFKPLAADPTDQVSQTKLIDLYASKKEAADEKMAYYQQLLSTAGISAEVKAHVYVRLAQLQLDRGQETDAKASTDAALNLSQLDPDALEMNEQFARESTDAEHVNALLGLLRGNPQQPAVAAQLAAELAEQGLTNEAATWYGNSVNMSNRANVPASPDVFAAYLYELLLAGQTKALAGPIDSLIQSDPTNAQALYLKLLLARRGDDKEAITKSIDAAVDGCLERLYSSYRAADKGTDPPSTRPTGDLAARTGDVAAQAAKVKASGDEAVIAQYAAALTDLAWLEIYFAEQPANAAPLISALHVLVPEDDARFARLEGWSLLVAKQPDPAKVKLSAAAEHDPLSAMGIIKIASADPKQADDVKSSAQDLLDQNRSGLVAAMLLDGLRNFGAVVQVSEQGKKMQADLNNFPKQWFGILDDPSPFFLITVTPVQISHPYDDPMLAVVTVTNVGGFDFSIGPKGMLKPDLWFDANVRGPGPPQSIGGVAYDRLGKLLVLKHGQAMQQVVRLDQPKLAQGLAMNPTVAYQLLFTLVTNPINGPSGIAPGPGGQRSMIKKPFERAANPLTPRNQQAMQRALTTESGDVRIRLLSMVTAYARAFMQADDPNVKAKASELAEAIGQLGGDTSPAVASWSRFQQMTLVSGPTAGAILNAMAQSDYWPQRLLAANIALAAGGGGKEFLQKFATDSDPIVKKFAEAALDDLAHPTTQPTSAPAVPPTDGTTPAPASPGVPTPAPGSDFKL